MSYAWHGVLCCTIPCRLCCFIILWLSSYRKDTETLLLSRPMMLLLKRGSWRADRFVVGRWVPTDRLLYSRRVKTTQHNKTKKTQQSTYNFHSFSFSAEWWLAGWLAGYVYFLVYFTYTFWYHRSKSEMPASVCRLSFTSAVDSLCVSLIS